MTAKTEAELLRAKRTAYNILAYADNTEAALRNKLIRRGYSGEAVDAAVAEMRATGALNEERMLRSRQNYLAKTRRFGKRRIELELRRLGFSRRDITEADWSQFDFVEICAELLRRAGELDKRMFSSLLRRGFTPSEIKAAAELAADEESI